MKDLIEADVRYAMIAADGSVSNAACKLGMPRGDLWGYIRQKPALLSVIADFRESLVDDAEMVLAAAVRAQKSWAVCFVLKTMGKGRGFDKNSPKCKAPPPVEPEPDMSRLTAEELVRWEQLQNIAGGSADGAYPEYMKRLDEAGVDIRATMAKCKGNLGETAKKLGITREELMAYLDRRPELQGLMTDRRDELIDYAEEILRSAIVHKKSWAVRFVLKTLGRSRGYSEAPLDKSKMAPDESAWDKLSEAELLEMQKLFKIMNAPSAQDAKPQAANFPAGAESDRNANAKPQAANFPAGADSNRNENASAKPQAVSAKPQAERGALGTFFEVLGAQSPHASPAFRAVPLNTKFPPTAESPKQAGNGRSPPDGT